MSNESKPLIMYHGHCMDGLGSAFAAWLHFGDDAEFLPVMYGNEPPSIELMRGRDVYLFDFTFPRAVMDSYADAASAFIVLDHHVHAAPLLEGTSYGHFNNEKSGAVLAFEHFFGDEPLPKLFAYLQDRDLWTRALPHHEEITQVIRQHSGEYDDPRTLRPIYERLQAGTTAHTLVILEGESLVKQVARFIRNDLTRCFVQVFSESMGSEIFAQYQVVYCTSTPNYVSDLAQEMLVAFPAADVACVSFQNEKGQWNNSLRSRSGSTIDVGAIAKREGGGGHVHSAGFISHIPMSAIVGGT